MEVDWMKPSTQEEIEMMKMMMQLHRHPELSLPYTNTSEVPEIKFPGGTAAINQTTTTPIYHNPFVTSTTFTNPPSSAPFISTPVQEPVTTPLSSTYFDTDSTIKPLSSQTTTNLKKIGTLFYTMGSNSDPVPNRKSMESMREMIFSMAAMQPIQIDPESVKPVKRRNVKISRDPQSVAARQRREKISEKIRILQRLVPGGTKMDTACMLDEAIHYVKFLKKQVQSLEQLGVNRSMGAAGVGLIQTRAILANRNYSSLVKGFPAYSSGGLYSNA